MLLLFKASFLSHGGFAIFPAPSAVQLRVGWPIMAGDGSSSCPLAGDHIFSSLQKPSRSYQVAGGGGVLNGELVGDRTTFHVPSHWDSLVDLLQRFNCYADLPRCVIASCRSNPTTMGNSFD